MGAKIDRDKLKSDLKAAGYKVTGEGLSKSSGSSGSAVSDRINEMRNDFGTRQDKLIANNPAFVYAKVYGDGKTGQEANKPVKGTAIPRSRFKPADTGRPLGRASAQRAFTSTPTGNFKGEAVVKSALSSSGAAYKKLGADVTSSTGNLSMGESARTAIGEAKAAKKEGRQVKLGQAQRKAEQDKVKSFNDGWAGDLKQKLLESAVESSKRAYEYEQEAKEGLGGFGQFAVDLGIAGAQFAGDIALNAALPGAGMAAMGMRAYGSASLDARRRGLSEGEQQISGLKSAAIEVLTEKLFGLGSKAAYGSGLIKNEKLINGIVNNLAKTNAGRTTLKLITGAAEEGAEEVLSDILNPVADRILKLDDGKGDWSDIGKDMDTQQMLADFLIGGTLGLFGAGTNVVNGQFKAENAQQRGYEKYQRELVNMGLEAEPGSRAQKAAETYKPIVEKSGKHFHRNLSDAETENLARLMDAPFAKKALADANILIDDNTADIIARAANGQRISQSERERLQKIPNIGEVINEVALTGVKARALERTFTQELQPDGITLPRGDELLRDKTIESAERLSKITGREIRLYDADPSENGYYDRATGELYINRNSKNPLAQVVGHELTHSIEDAGAYTDLKSVIFSQIQKQGGDLAKMRQEKAALYEKHGHTLGSEEEIDAEIVAEFVEKNLLTDEASIKAVVTQSPSLGQRILQFINDLLAKIGDRKAQERAFLTKARGYYQTALRETENRPVNVTFKAESPTQAAPSAKTTQAQTTQTTQEAAQEVTTREASQAQEAQTKSSEMTPDEYLESLRDQLARGEISEDEFSDLFDEYYNGGTERQYSFAEQKASTANLEHLKNAQEMETLGADMKSIRKTTGWFKGMDGKWRFEIDDSGMEYRNTAGEIEARDAASRRTLTPEERKNKAPDLGDENTVFAEDGKSYSISEVEGTKRKYGEGVILDTDIFNGIPPKKWGNVLSQYVYENMAGAELTMYDETGAPEKVFLARSTDRVTKDGSKNSHKVIDKLAGYRGDTVRAQAIVQLSEVLASSTHKASSNEHTHQWMDENGWLIRTAYLQTQDGNIYEATLNIADGRNRKILYEINRVHQIDKIKNLSEHTDTGESQRSRYQEHEPGRTQSEIDNSIPTSPQSVNKQFSVSERTPEQKKEILAQARRYASGEIGKDEFFRHVDSIDGTRRSAPSRNAYRQPPKNQSYSDEAREIYDRAHSEGVSVDEYLRRNWEEFDIDGRWSDAAQEALRMDGRRYSVEEETANEEEPKEPRVRDTIPKKAETYLKRAEGALVKDLSDKLNVPKFAQKEYLNEIAQEISEEYLKTGTVSEETKNELFETAWENGRHIDDEFYNTYKDIKDYLRTQSVTLAETDKTNITDWNQFKNSAFGSLRIVNKGGLPVDTAYQELQGMAPELFPPDITHPADQIQRMLEVSKSISVSEKSLDDHFGRNAEEYKKWARADFETAITDSLSVLRTVKRYVEDGKAPAEKLHTIDEVQNAYKGLKEARKKYEIANAKNLLTDHDKIQVGRLLRGEIELEHLDPKQDNVKGISAVFEAQEEYERIARTIREWNAQRKQELRDEADEYLQTANDWKDKKSGILYARETQERNVLDIVPDEKIAKAINRKYFMPVHQAEAKSTQFKKTMRGRVAALKLSTKETKAMKKAGKVSEAHAVQLIGEARDNAEMASRSRDKTRDGKTEAEWRAIEAELWKNNPDLDKAKIENAIKEFRGIYDELLNMMNDVRIENGYEPVNYRRGYFPHFKKDSADNIIGLFGRALGIKTDVTELPTTINGMTHMFRPGIQWFGNALERTGFETTYDAVEGFDRYIEGVANVIYQTENIQRLRALASQARYRTGPEGLRKQIDAVRADTGKTEAEKTAIIDDLNANGKYELSNWVVNLDEYTNILAGKKSMADRNLEQALGRDMYNVVKAVESRVAANMVAINVGSWLTNFIPITQGYALLGTKDLLTGMQQTLAAMKESDGMVEASAFLTNRIGSDPLVQTWAQKASAKLSSPMSWIDNFTAGTLVRARYNQNIRQGMSEAAAMEDADTFAANVMADRSKGSTPTLFNQSNPVTKLFTQFQLEVNNQLSYLFKDIPRETKDKGVKALALALLKFFLGAYLFDEAYEYFIGRRPALDPIGILVDTAQDIANGESAYDVITGTLEDTAEQLPFIGGILGGGRIPISSALPDAGNLLRAATNEDWDSKKRWSTIGKELAKPATYTLLPFGGGQIKKVAQGIDATIRGGSYTYDADGNDILQYPVYNQSFGDSAKSIAESVLFGKTALPTGREWIGSGFKSFGAKETAAYKELTESGTSQKDVYDTLKAIRAEKTNNGKRTAIADSSLTDNEKRILYNHIFGEKQENGTYKSTRTEEIAAFKEAGLDMDDFLKAQNQYTDIGKEYDTTSEKALAFSRWVNQQGWTADQKAAVNDSFKYYSQIPATAANYNSFADAGLSDETAYKLAKAINDLEPQDGADTVSSAQKWRAVVDTVKNTNDQLAALAQVMSESEYRKVSAGRAHGVEPSSYVAFKESLPKFDADGNGTFKQAEIKAAIDAMGEKYGTVLPGGSKLTIAQQAVLWQLANKSWKPKNNPYSVAIGQKVYNELNAK